MSRSPRSAGVFAASPQCAKWQVAAVCSSGLRRTMAGYGGSSGRRDGGRGREMSCEHN
jgi:hypothetical protein